ncbi:MAG: hypothetical protein MZU91_00495 [Desulfosudis oleivorans]|nr:hypothetical protein [Desulfosudis oleivorans]
MAGLSTILGIGGTAGLFELHHPAEALQQLQHMKDRNALTAKRWAMVIDTRKFKTDEDCRRCIDACHKAHNVPDIEESEAMRSSGSGKRPSSTPSRDRSTSICAEDLKHKPFLVLCNHCDNPPLRPGLPDQGDLQAAGRHRRCMDSHRCIGCRFCMAGCPFGARSFNFERSRGPSVKRDPTRNSRHGRRVSSRNAPSATSGWPRVSGPACVEASNGASSSSAT